MPFNKRTIQPILLSQIKIPNGIPNEFECVANRTVANIIRQLSSLCFHAQDLFNELIADAEYICNCTQLLQSRIEKLKINEELNNSKPFHSSIRIDQQILNRRTMPPSVRLLYERAESAPALHLLDPYRDDGRDSMKFYTDTLQMQACEVQAEHDQQGLQSSSSAIESSEIDTNIDDFPPPPSELLSA